jgi:pyridoxine 5-phosphate synthase
MSRRRLGVNVDHVATLRQARRAVYPDPVQAAMIAETAGASQITCHIRSDRRHVNERDIRMLRGVVTTQLNVECAATDEMLGIMCSLKPHRVTLVPERPDEVTTEGGLDVVGRRDEIRAACSMLRGAGMHVALFIDPESAQVEASAMDGVDMIELNTARYAEEHPESELERLYAGWEIGAGLGLQVAAGHGLTHLNLEHLVQHVPGIVEYNIGHSIISRSVFVGLDTAVRDLVALLRD